MSRGAPATRDGGAEVLLAKAGQVLVVDDEAAVRTLVGVHLEQEGYGVREAADADRALELARQSTPVLVVLDVHMPYKDGWAVLAAMRDDPDLVDVRVVMAPGMPTRAPSGGRGTSARWPSSASR